MAEVFSRAHSPGSARFEMRDDGVFYIGGRDSESKAKPEQRICGRLDILARTCNDQNEEWGLLVEWRDYDHHVHTWAMPMELLETDPARVRGELARLGLSIAPGRPAHELFVVYLQEWPADKRVRCVNRLGWHGSDYVTPSETISNNSKKVVFQNVHAVEPASSVSITTEEWRNRIAAPARGNSRIMFSICVAFAGPLLEPAGEDSGGFHFRGQSWIGKTTLTKTAASVYGKPEDYGHLWRATSNGLEGLAALNNDSILILDELGQVDPREAGEFATSSPTARARLGPLATARHDSRRAGGRSSCRRENSLSLR